MNRPNRWSRTLSSWRADVAARAVILIESDDPAIGLVCLMPVGMVEVSSCIIRPEVRPGHRVRKGEEVGYFQYGGSTYCLISRPGTVAGFASKPPQSDNPDPPVVRLGTRIHGQTGGFHDIRLEASCARQIMSAPGGRLLPGRGYAVCVGPDRMPDSA